MKKNYITIFLITAFLFSACGQTLHTGEPVTETQAVSATETISHTESLETSEPEEEVYIPTVQVTVTHKEEYTEAIYNALMSLPSEKPTSTLKQADIDCDTLQWFNATYAMFTYSNNGDISLIGGSSDASGTPENYIYSALENSWGIVDRATAIQKIAWLATDGHSPSFVELIQMMAEFNMLDCTPEELTSFLEEVGAASEWTEEDLSYAISYYQDMKESYEVCGENGIDAWDYCRIMQLCGSCYYAGYFTLEESLEIQLITAKAIQSQFNTWTEMNDSYYHGYRYWAYGSYTVSARKLAYDQLMIMKDSPFTTLDFNMPLEKFW